MPSSLAVRIELKSEIAVSPISSQPVKAPLSPEPCNQVFFKETKAAELIPFWKLWSKLSSTVPPWSLISPKPVFIVTVLFGPTVKALSEATVPKAKVAPVETTAASFSKSTPYGLVVFSVLPVPGTTSPSMRKVPDLMLRLSAASAVTRVKLEAVPSFAP